MLNLEPATRVLAGLVRGIDDGQLDAPTPCRDTSVGDLLDHVDGLSLAFTEAASKRLGDATEQAADPDAARLTPDWRQRIPDRLAGLANAWNDEAAWTGMTQAGGVDLPGEVAGLVALDEVVVHGWDIAAASGQRFSCDPHLLEALHGFVRQTADENPQGSPGLFGPPVPVANDAHLLDRVIALTGRDPSWRSG